MGAIDIGPGAKNLGGNGGGGYTRIDPGNPANDTGTLTSFEIYASGSNNLSNCKMGTFYGSGTSYTNRDYELIGTVTYGSKQTFTGKSCDVETGDYLGQYHTEIANSYISQTASSGSGQYYKLSDTFGGGSVTYSFVEKAAIAIYATGETGGGGWAHITKVDGVTASGAAKKDGIAVGSVAKINGVAV